MQLEEWKSQIRRGTLEYGILLLASRGPCYGYEILSTLAKWPMLTTNESTVYPLLRRLHKDGLLEAYWQETEAGLPPRKYYTVTPAGAETLQAMQAAWQDLACALDEIGEEK